MLQDMWTSQANHPKQIWLFPSSVLNWNTEYPVYIYAAQKRKIITENHKQCYGVNTGNSIVKQDAERLILDYGSL